MPRAAPYPASLLGLIQSTSYPPLPHLEELEVLRQALVDHRSSSGLTKRKRDDDAKTVVENNEKASRALEAAERHRLGSVKASPGPGLTKVKKERSVSPSGSIASSSSFKPGPQQPVTYAGMNKKKKKRALDSDDEGRERSVASPPSHHTTSTSGLKLKIAKSRPVDPSPTPSHSTGTIGAGTSGPGGSIDFSLPAQPLRPLIPLRPGIQPPPVPGPKRQAEVDEDFSNTKAPNQVAQPTFWSSVDPYLREIREDDLAMLNFKADAPELFEVPPRGRHYTEVWDEEDGNPVGTTPRLPIPALRQGTNSNAGAGGGTGMTATTTAFGVNGQTTPHFVPAAELKDEQLVSEYKGLGSLTERLVAGVFGRRANKKDDSKHGSSVSGDSDKYDGNRDVAPVDVGELEDRIRRELRGVMLLSEQEDYINGNRDDDEVTAALRQCQRLLLEQTQINDARKARLAEIAKHRLAYAEYSASLDGLEKSIEAAWAKRVKKHGSAPKKTTTAANGAGSTTTHGRPPVPENVKKLVQVRKEWVDTVGKTMRERPRGEVMGLPLTSVYDGIGDELDEQVVEDAMVLEDGVMEVDDDHGSAR